MTFSIAGRCARTGEFGAAVSTSSIAVGSRVPFARTGVGAVLTQHRTDPRLGSRGLDLLQSGCSASQTVDALVESTKHIGWRQLAAIDAAGRTAAYSGELVKPHRGEVQGRDCVAIGNILANDRVVPTMVSAFEAAPQERLAERLLRGLEAGLEAGGERGPVRSAVLFTVHRERFPLVDLRIDWADAPIAKLRALWNEYLPSIEEFVIRAVDPDRAKGDT
jgi:uncharacterized Ntn-hydrolase superfamily protein